MNHDYAYGQFGPQHLKAIQKGLILFNEEKYWECHEELEDHWLSDTADQARYVYWAIIQVANALFHLRDANMAGARGQLKKAKEKFDFCEKLNVETDLCDQYFNWSGLKKIARETPHHDKTTPENFDRLRRFRFRPDPNKWEI